MSIVSIVWQTFQSVSMPFVLRQVTPVRLSRLPTSDGTERTVALSATATDDDPRQLITNQTLSACLRQLASLVSLAADIFTHCQDEASVLHQRTIQLRQRLDRLQSNADQLDSRSVPIRKFPFFCSNDFFAFAVAFLFLFIYCVSFGRLVDWSVGRLGSSAQFSPHVSSQVLLTGSGQFSMFTPYLCYGPSGYIHFLDKLDNSLKKVDVRRRSWKSKCSVDNNRHSQEK